MRHSGQRAVVPQSSAIVTVQAPLGRMAVRGGKCADVDPGDRLGRRSPESSASEQQAVYRRTGALVKAVPDLYSSPNASANRLSLQTGTSHFLGQVVLVSFMRILTRSRIVLQAEEKIRSPSVETFVTIAPFPVEIFVESCKLTDVLPQAWLEERLTYLTDHPISKVVNLLLWNWRAAQQPNRAAVA